MRLASACVTSLSNADITANALAASGRWLPFSASLFRRFGEARQPDAMFAFHGKGRLQEQVEFVVELHLLRTHESGHRKHRSGNSFFQK